MELLSSHMYKIDRENNIIEGRSAENQSVIKYISVVTYEILNENSGKRFKIKNLESEVVAIVFESDENKCISQEQCEKISKKLLKEEIIAQRGVEQLNVTIKEGALIQTYFLYDEKYYYLLTKVESTDFLTESQNPEDLRGYPHTKGAIRNCLFEFDLNNKLLEIYVSDGAKRIATHWHNNFLELEEKTNNEISTKVSFEFLEMQLKRDIEKISKRDYLLCRNGLISYFSTQSRFELSEMLDYVFGEYEPLNQQVDINIIKGNIESKYRNKSFDTMFSIVTSAISDKRKSYTRKVNDLVDVKLNGSSEEIKNLIFVEKEADGREFLKVRITDKETLRYFNWEKE